MNVRVQTAQSSPDYVDSEISRTREYAISRAYGNRPRGVPNNIGPGAYCGDVSRVQYAVDLSDRRE